MALGVERGDRVRRPSDERDGAELRLGAGVARDAERVEDVVRRLRVVGRLAAVLVVVLEEAVDPERVVGQSAVDKRARQLVLHAGDVGANLVLEHGVLVLGVVVELLRDRDLGAHHAGADLDLGLAALVRGDAAVVGRPNRLRRLRAHGRREGRTVVRLDDRHVVEHLNLFRHELDDPVDEVALRIEALDEIGVSEYPCSVYLHFLVPSYLPLVASRSVRRLVSHPRTRRQIVISPMPSRFR